jgi:hypothetical protein
VFKGSSSTVLFPEGLPGWVLSRQDSCQLTGSAEERRKSHAFGMGMGYDTSCMKALRCVKSLWGFLLILLGKVDAFDAQLGTRRRTVMLSSGDERESLFSYRRFSLAALDLPSRVRCIAHLLVLAVSL